MSFNVGTAINNLAKTKLSNPATADLDLQNTFNVINSAPPVLNTDLATKLYVDNVAAGGGSSAGTLPFLLQRGSGGGAVTVGEFTNPSGDDLQLSAPTTTGRLIFQDIHGVDFNNSPLTQTTTTGTGVSLVSGGNNNVLSIVKNAGNFAGNLITLNNSGNFSNGQRAIDITHGTNDAAINIANRGTGGSLNITQVGAGHCIQINKASGSGSIPLLDINNTGTSNMRLCEITNTNASSTGDNLYLETNATDANAHCLEIVRTGNGNNIISTANGGNNNVVITNSTTSGKALQINANQTNGSVGLEVNKTGTGNAIAIDNTSSGSVASITSTGGGITFTHSNSGTQNMVNLTRSGGTGGRLLNMTYSNSGSEDVVRIDRTSGSGSGNLINLINNTAGVMINSSQSGTGVNINATNTASSGSSNNVEFIKSGSGNGGNVFIRNVDSVGASTGIALSILNQGVSDCLRIQDEAGDSTLMRVDSDGNVGIGVPTTALTNKFESNAGTGTTTTQIAQSTTTNAITVSDSSLGTSRLLLNTTGTEIAGRSDIILEPSRGTAGAGTTPRIRMTVASGSNNGILLQGNNATAGTNFRYGFTSGSTGETSMNVYSDIATRRVRIGQQDIYSGIPSGVLELTRNATPHGTTIPHILLNGTNASDGTVMNCNGGRIINVADPSSGTDVANRQWVLSQVGASPTQIFTGQNKFVTTASGITQQADAGQSMNMGINSGGQKNIQSYSPNVLINVPSGSTTNDNQVMEAWSSSITGTYTTSTTDLAFAIKPRTNQAYVGRFQGADIQNIGPTANGILQIWKNSGIHSTAPHIRLVGADSPVLPSSIAINCNGAGRITGVNDPTSTNDVMNAKVETVVGSDLVSRSTIASYLRPVLSAPLISYFYNASGAFGANSTTRGSNPHYLLCSDCAPSNSFSHSSSVLSLCPIEFKTATLNGFGSVTAGIWKMNRVGIYKITYEYKAGAFPNGSAFTDASFSSLLIYQGPDSGIAPSSTSPTSSPPYIATRRRVSSSGFMLCNQLEFYVVNDGTSNCFTFGSSNLVPQNWENFTVSSFYSLLTAEYIGNTYA